MATNEDTFHGKWRADRSGKANITKPSSRQAAATARVSQREAGERVTARASMAAGMV